MEHLFPNLFSEFAIGQCKLRNRIVSTGHHTYLADDRPDERLIAYHEARARGGAGLIVSEIVAIHETAGFSNNLLKIESADAIPAYRRLVDAVHQHDTRLFAQLFHPGREILSSPTGMLPIAWAPSAVPNERFHIMPKAMPLSLIGEIIEGYGRAAGMLADAGFDGFEIVASHGYLPSQFLNPHTNLRDDAYGGDAERRLRFLRDVISAIRTNAEGLVVGLRISGSELDSYGLSESDVVEASVTLAAELDYLNITAGTSASLGASVHITPPMGIANAYLAPLTSHLRKQVDIPVLLSGRINQPQVAEQVLAKGEADLLGMTRALICDPQMPNKAIAGKADDIRACIGCNQACIGRAHKGLAISCIQFPESGRELEFAEKSPAAISHSVLVVGGGPAGMKAAATAARRGHQVKLFEATGSLGGQALLAQCLPGRQEFGGIVSNLQHEMQSAGVEVVLKQPVTPDVLAQLNPDAIIVATGAEPYLPSFEGHDSAQVCNAWEVLNNTAAVGSSVVIADWRADWIGLGLAEKLVTEGHSVTLCVNAALAGETLQIYTRNHYVGRLHKLGVNIQTHLRLFGFDEGSCYFQNTLSEEAVEIDNVDTLVLSLGHQPVDSVLQFLKNSDTPVHAIGDCVVARTAEEAVYEGLITGNKL